MRRLVTNGQLTGVGVMTGVRLDKVHIQGARSSPSRSYRPKYGTVIIGRTQSSVDKKQIATDFSVLRNRTMEPSY